MELAPLIADLIQNETKVTTRRFGCNIFIDYPVQSDDHDTARFGLDRVDKSNHTHLLVAISDGSIVCYHRRTGQPQRGANRA